MSIKTAIMASTWTAIIRLGRESFNYPKQPTTAHNRPQQTTSVPNCIGRPQKSSHRRQQILHYHPALAMSTIPSTIPLTITTIVPHYHVIVRTINQTFLPYPFPITGLEHCVIPPSLPLITLAHLALPYRSSIDAHILYCNALQRAHANATLQTLRSHSDGPLNTKAVEIGGKG